MGLPLSGPYRVWAGTHLANNSLTPPFDTYYVDLVIIKQEESKSLHMLSGLVPAFPGGWQTLRSHNQQGAGSNQALNGQNREGLHH